MRINKTLTLSRGARLLSGAALAIAGVGCVPAEAPRAASFVSGGNVELRAAAGDTALDIYIDTSRSPDNDILNRTANTLYMELPSIALELGAHQINVYRFGTDGWAISPVASVALPERTSAESDTACARWRDLANMEKACVAKSRDSLHEVRTAADKLARQAVASLAFGSMQVADSKAEPRCTDVNGMLRRASQKGGSGVHYGVILTDLADTCTGRLERLESPDSTRSVVVLIIPPRASAVHPSPRLRFVDAKVDEASRTLPWLKVQAYDLDPGSIARLLRRF